MSEYITILSQMQWQENIFPAQNLVLTAEINSCESSPCQFGGSCEDLIGGYKCHCTAPYEGVNCEKREYCRYAPNLWMVSGQYQMYESENNEDARCFLQVLVQSVIHQNTPFTQL